MDPREALDLATEEFSRRLLAVTDEQWGEDTPCPEWTVRGLVDHVVAGNREAVTVLRGGDAADAQAAAGEQAAAGDDLRAAFARTSQEQVAAFADVADGTVVHHPLGDLPASSLLSFRIADLVLHGWDLARAVGGDEGIDPELAELVLAHIESMGQAAADSGFFGTGPSGDLPADAGVQARLLDLSGRRP